MSRSKKQVPQMLPVKKWLSKTEALAYLDLSVNVFQELVAAHGLTVSSLTPKGSKTYYKVSELDSLFDKSILQKLTA